MIVPNIANARKENIGDGAENIKELIDSANLEQQNFNRPLVGVTSQISAKDGSITKQDKSSFRACIWNTIFL